MSNYPVDSEQTKIKNLSDESQYLLDELDKRLHEIEISSKSASELIPRLYESLKKDGLSPQQARKLIEEKVDVSQRTLRRALPAEAKRPYNSDMMSESKKLPNGNLAKPKPSNAMLIVEKEPDIPAMPHTIIEPIELPPPQRPDFEELRDIKLSWKLWDSHSFRKIMLFAKQCGEEYANLKVNRQGIIYLPV